MVAVAERVGLGAVGGAEQRLGDIFEDAKAILYREIDYRDEAANAMRFARDFESLPWVVTPRVFPALCTERLLVMEYLPGVKISDVAALDEGGYDRKRLAEALAKAYLYQFCKFGFYNTDPHPGRRCSAREERAASPSSLRQPPLLVQPPPLPIVQLLS